MSAVPDLASADADYPEGPFRHLSYGWVSGRNEVELRDLTWAQRNYWRVYQNVYREERERAELIDLGGEG